MARRSRLSRKPWRRLLLNLKTGEEFSANPRDYFIMRDEDTFANLVLVEDKPVRGKGVVGGFKRVIVKTEPRKRDL